MDEVVDLLILPTEVVQCIINVLDEATQEKLARFNSPYRVYTVSLLYQHIYIGNVANLPSKNFRGFTVESFHYFYEQFPNILVTDLYLDQLSLLRVLDEIPQALDIVKNITTVFAQEYVHYVMFQNNTYLEGHMVKSLTADNYKLQPHLTVLPSNLKQLKIDHPWYWLPQVPDGLEVLEIVCPGPNSSLVKLPLPASLTELTFQFTNSTSKGLDLTNLVKLEKLEYRNDIESISEFKFPTSLKTLKVDGDISDPTGLELLTHLDSLEFYWDQLYAPFESKFLPPTLKNLKVICGGEWKLTNKLDTLDITTDRFSYANAKAVTINYMLRERSEKDLSAATNITNLCINSDLLTSPTDITYPSNLTSLSFVQTGNLHNLKGLDNLLNLRSVEFIGAFLPIIIKEILRGRCFPPDLTSLTLKLKLGNQLAWLLDIMFNPSWYYLDNEKNHSTPLVLEKRFVFPRKLEFLKIQSSFITAVGNLSLPDTLKELELEIDGYRRLGELKLPPNLRLLQLPNIIPKSDFVNYKLPENLSLLCVCDDTYKVTRKNYEEIEWLEVYPPKAKDTEVFGRGK